MNLGTTARKWIGQAAGALMNCFRQRFHPDSRSPNEGPDAGNVVLAVTSCYPTRIVLYAAAFQGGWDVRIMKSLSDAFQASRFCDPKAVIYDYRGNHPGWEQQCSSFSREGIPVVVLSHRTDDDTFLTVLAAGGYLASGDPLTSEEIVRTVDFAAEVAALAQVPVS